MSKHIAEELAEQFPLSVCLVCKAEKPLTAQDLHRQIETHFDKCCGAYPQWLTSPQIEKYHAEKERLESRNKRVTKTKTLDISDRAV